MGDTQNAGELVLGQLRASLDGSRYSLTAVYAAVTVAFGGALVVVLAVLAGWHALQEVYAPRPLLSSQLAAYSGDYSVGELRHSELRPSLRRCLKDVHQVNERVMLAKSGLDAVVYLRALRMMRNIFVLLTVLLFCVAAPINIVYNFRARYVDNLTKKDALLLLTPTLLSGNTLAAHVVLGWVTNAVVFALLWYNYGRVLALRQELFRTPRFQEKLSNRTLLLTDLPKSLRTTEGVAKLLDGAGRPVSSISVGQRSSTELSKLVEIQNAKTRQLERELMKSQQSKKSMELSVELSRLAKAIESHRARLRQMSLQGSSWHKEQHHSYHLSSSYGFASFTTVKDSQITLQRVKHHACPGSGRVKRAPPPEQLLWNNLELTATQRGTKQLLVNALFGTLVILWIVPSAFIGCFLANLNRLGAVWPAFDKAMKTHPVGFAILQGVLAPLITTAVFSVLPAIFRKFSHRQGKVTRVEREREVLRKLYLFFFLDNFFLFTIMGVIWDIVAQVLQQTKLAESAGQSLSFEEVWRTLRVAERIATAVMNLSSFWVLYLLRGIFALFGGAAQPVTLTKRLSQALNFTRKPTPRELAEASMPQPFQYAQSFLSILFNATIALGFTSIQPLVLPIAMILFALSVPVKKYQLLHMEITKYESNGMFWPYVHDMTLFALAVGNLILLCVVWVQAGWRVAAGACPLVATILVFKVVTLFKFQRPFYTPDTLELPYNSREKQHSSLRSEGTFGDASLSAYYGNPAWTCELEKPLLTREEAILYYALRQPSAGTEDSIYDRDDVEATPSMDKYSVYSSGLRSSFSNGSINAPAAAGAVWAGDGSAYSPHEPQPVFRSDHHEDHLPVSEMWHFAGQGPEDRLLR